MSSIRASKVLSTPMVLCMAFSAPWTLLASSGERIYSAVSLSTLIRRMGPGAGTVAVGRWVIFVVKSSGFFVAGAYLLSPGFILFMFLIKAFVYLFLVRAWELCLVGGAFLGGG